MEKPFTGPNPTGHEYSPWRPDLTRPPIEEMTKPLLLAIRREDLPEVHTVHKLPHIHLETPEGDEYAVHTMAGDSPRDLVNMGLHYIALGLALREQLGMEWDTPWTGPAPEGQPGWIQGEHRHD